MKESMIWETYLSIDPKMWSDQWLRDLIISRTKDAKVSLIWETYLSIEPRMWSDQWLRDLIISRTKDVQELMIKLSVKPMIWENQSTQMIKRHRGGRWKRQRGRWKRMCCAISNKGRGTLSSGDTYHCNVLVRLGALAVLSTNKVDVELNFNHMSFKKSLLKKKTISKLNILIFLPSQYWFHVLLLPSCRPLNCCASLWDPRLHPSLHHERLFLRENRSMKYCGQTC